jgi:regulator of protease activity HflC (stomatin/prohibitin superfamily)
LLKYGVGAVLLVLAVSVLSPFVVIPAGHRGVVTTFGRVNDDVLGEGLHFVLPIMNAVTRMTVQIQKGEGEGEAASKDLQQVHTRVAVNYHLKPENVALTFRDIGNLDAVETRLLLPAVQEAVKATTAQYTAEELIAKRSDVRDRIRAAMVERMTRHGIIIDEFSIVNFSFSKSFNEAIESKTTAEQLKLKAERDLERIRVEAEQKVASARAEAESLRIQKQEVTAELIHLREIENQRKAIEKWDGHLPNVTGGGIPFINVQGVSR